LPSSMAAANRRPKGTDMELRNDTNDNAQPGANTHPARRGHHRGRRRQAGQLAAKTATSGGALQWITARIPEALARQLEAHATATGTNRSDAIRECLEVGIEAVQLRHGVPEGRVDDIVGRLDTVLLALDAIGPSILGMLRLLAHWAAQDGSVKVGEDEVVTEVRAIGSEEWDQLISEGQRAADQVVTAPLTEER
jgi:hypothetical protein